jgi:hypothetical protein
MGIEIENISSPGGSARAVYSLLAVSVACPENFGVTVLF